MLFRANALCSVVAVQRGCRSFDHEEVGGDICGYYLQLEGRQQQMCTEKMSTSFSSLW